MWLKNDERVLLLSKPDGQEICLHEKFVWVGKVDYSLTDWDGKVMVSHLDLWQVKIVLEEFGKALNAYSTQKSDEKSKAFLAYMDWFDGENDDENSLEKSLDKWLLAKTE